LGDALAVDFLQIPQFFGCATAAKPVTSILPGQGVLVIDNSCPKPIGSQGSIGAFLEFVDAKKDDPKFLLSACHVLGRSCQKSPQVFLPDEKSNIASNVRCVDMKKQGNAVDAAVAEIKTEIEAQNIFTKITVTTDVPSLPAIGDPVQKLGVSTGATNGRL